MTSNFKLTLLSGVAAATVMAFVGTANATNGYFSNAYGTAAKGMAGASVALPQDTQAAMNNPAGMKKIGSRVDGSVALFSPLRKYETSGANPAANFMNDNQHKSGSNFFVIPAFGANWDMGEYSLGVTLSANGGMNTDYGTNVFSQGSNGRTGINLEQAFLGFTYARQIGDSNTVGITPTIAAQRFSARGLQGFAAISTDGTKLTDNGNDYSYGYGVRVGWLGEVNDKLSFGAMAQSRMYMQKFSKYAGLFAEQGDFDIPPTVSFGGSYKVDDKLTIAADVQRIFYDQVASVSNPLINVTSFNTNAGGTVGLNSLGGDQGVGFGWQNMSIGKLGVQYDASDDVTLRAGVSHNTQAFPNTETLFNILAPAVVNTHVSVGGTYDVAPNMSLSLAYTHAFNANITGSNPNHATPIDLQMKQHDLEVGVSYAF